MANHTGAVLRAVRSLEYLRNLLNSGADIDRLIEGYLETRKLLAKAFQEMAKSHLVADQAVLEPIRLLIEERMRSLYGNHVSSELLTVRKYGATHQLLAGYLLPRVGTPVSASKLRLLTGDQVHTERRVRELRELGLAVHAEKVAGENQYILITGEPDIDGAAAIQIVQNIKQSGLTARRRADLLQELGLQ